MSKRNGYLITYLSVMCALTILRITFYEGVWGDMDDWTSDTVFSCFAQIFCMGLIPLLGIWSCNRAKGGRENLLAFRETLSLTPVKGKKMIIAVIILTVLHPIINGGVSTVWANIVRWTGYTSIVSDAVVYSGIGHFFLGVLLTGILPAVFEECTHRGLALRACGGSVHKRVLLSALLFALMHQNILQTGYTFIGGLIMGYVTVYTGSIFPAMLIHFVNNFFVVIREYSASINGIVSEIYRAINAISSTTWGMILFTVIWIVATSVVAIIIYKWSEKDKGEFTCVVEDKGKGERVLSRFLWTAVIAIGAITTIYSYVWGLMR